jgi:inner membrane protein
MNESKLKSSVVLRMFIIAALTLLLLVPTAFVAMLVSERSSRREAATLEVSQSWGGAQTLVGPVLSVPFKEFTRDERGNTSFSVRYAHFLPATLLVKGTLQPELRYRGIYEVPLYSSHFVVEGWFASLDVGKLPVSTDTMLWEDAFVSFGITDLNGVRDTITLQWDGARLASEPGVIVNDVLASGITFQPRIEKGRSSYAFSFSLSLNGSSEIRFVPVGEVTEVVLDSPWGHPSFVGRFLPHTRAVNADNFHAEWKVLNLNRNFPQAWVGDRYTVVESSFGASLYLPVDQYQKSERSVKYALLFIALTFVAFFLSEIITKTALHPIQYALVGLALVLFYVLLLSLSEHLGFNLAYAVASLGIISLVTLYASWISDGKRIPFVITLVLSALYGFLYVVLQLQDYALLLGSVGLFVVLFIVMYLTRKIDWFSVNRS